MASGIYDRFRANLMNKVVDLEADTIKVALYNNSHTFTTGDTVYTTTNELATENGYTRGDKELAGKSVTEGATTKFDGDNTVWTAASFTAYNAVIYDETATSELICSIDFSGAKTVTSGTFTLAWNASGIITLT